MGKLKDESKAANDWKVIDLSENEIMYIKSVLYLTEAMIAQFRQTLDAVTGSYINTNLAPRAGFDVNDKLQFDFDEKNKQLRLRLNAQ